MILLLLRRALIGQRTCDVTLSKWFYKYMHCANFPSTNFGDNKLGASKRFSIQWAAVDSGEISRVLTQVLLPFRWYGPHGKENSKHARTLPLARHCSTDRKPLRWNLFAAFYALWIHSWSILLKNLFVKSFRQILLKKVSVCARLKTHHFIYIVTKTKPNRIGML